MAGNTKSTKKSKVIILSLASQVLSRFPASTPPFEDTVKSEKATPAATIPESSADKSSEENATPIPLNGGEAQDTTTVAVPAPVSGQADGKRKRAPPNPNARKRAPPTIDPDAPLRERPRAAPRKRQRGGAAAAAAAAESNETAEAKAAAANGTAPAPKLGPKANTGAINAGLRALDRSGKPCRRWQKTGLKLKSFTGSTWAMPTWKGSQRPNLNADGEVQSDSSSEVKPMDASGLISENNSAMDAGDTTMMNGIESSPAPPIAA